MHYDTMGRKGRKNQEKMQCQQWCTLSKQQNERRRSKGGGSLAYSASRSAQRTIAQHVCSKCREFEECDSRVAIIAVQEEIPFLMTRNVCTKRSI